jgi:hypothetical protein
MCPPGTYYTGLDSTGATKGLTDSRSCTPCDAGHYCPYMGQTSVDSAYVCDAGFICYGGSARPEPTDLVRGEICPTGGYCLQGGTTVTLCTAGEVGLFQAAYDITACVACEAGYYCKGLGGSDSKVICPAGYFCPEGSADYSTNEPAAGYYADTGYER